jgi:hypothetical protein
MLQAVFSPRPKELQSQIAIMTQEIECFGYYRARKVIISAGIMTSKSAGLNGFHFDWTALEGQKVAPPPRSATCMLRIQ